MNVKAMILGVLMALCVLPVEASKVSGNGKVITKEIRVDEYTAVSINRDIVGNDNVSWFSFFTNRGSSSCTFYYRQGEKATVKITTDENILPLLEVSTKNGELRISAKSKTALSPTSLKINATSKELEKASFSGGINFELQSALTSKSLTVSASGGSDLDFKHPVSAGDCKVSASGGGDVVFSDLNCESISCEASGGSDLSLAGKAENGRYRASGGSDIKAKEFVVKRLDCSASGGSDIYCHATEELDASASGGSDVHYKGSPKATTSASGGSDIDKLD